VQSDEHINKEVNPSASDDIIIENDLTTKAEINDKK
jgi:hypothetical protein